MKYVPHLLYVVRKEKMYEKEIAELQKIIDESSRIVFFGGAGVSTESGIPDFRSADGIYHQKYKYSPEQVVSHSFFIKYPEAFYEFYNVPRPPAMNTIFIFLSSSISLLISSDGHPRGPTKSSNASPALRCDIFSVDAPTI